MTISNENQLDELYKAAVGKEVDHYIKLFKKFDENDISVSWNWDAFLFGPIWLLSRTMGLYFVLYLLSFSLLLGIFSISDINITGVVIFFVVFLSLFANAFYYFHIKRRIKKVTAVYPDHNTQINVLNNRAVNGRKQGLTLIVSFLLVSLIFFYSFYNSQASFKEGLKYYYGQKDYEQALKIFRPLAVMGHSRAQHHLGFMYQNGLGVQQDYQRAIQWYLRSAEQGNPYTQNNLGYMYRYGKGVEQDHQKAIEWFMKAAAQGNASAQSQLASMYRKGQGVQKDKKQAAQWYQKSADLGERHYEKKRGHLKNTQGIITWSRGHRYEGEIKNGMRNGHGVKYIPINK